MRPLASATSRVMMLSRPTARARRATTVAGRMRATTAATTTTTTRATTATATATRGMRRARGDDARDDARTGCARRGAREREGRRS